MDGVHKCFIVYHTASVCVWRHWQKLVSYLVGNFVIHLPQQLFRFGGAICTSHWRSFSIASGSPEWRTNGFCGTIKKNKHIFHFAKKKTKTKTFECQNDELPLRMWHCCRCPADPMQHPCWPVPVHVVSSSNFHVVCRQLGPLVQAPQSITNITNTTQKWK